MPVAVADSYSTASGGSVYAGRAAPIPLWLQGKALNTWFPIPGSALMQTGAAAHAFCGMGLAERQGKAVCVVAAAGGHGDSYDNRVVGIDLTADSPAWTTYHANSGTASDPGNQPYSADGRPASRHTYNGTFYVPQLDRVMLIGAPVVWGTGTITRKVDGFDLGSGKWDGVVPDYPGISGSGYADCLETCAAGCINPATGDIWTAQNYFEIYKWSAATKTQTKVTTFGGSEPRGPSCWDSARNQFVYFGWNEGGVRVKAFIYAADGLSRQALTLSGSAAATLAATPTPSDDSTAVTYDPLLDKFYMFRADEGGNKVYVITPNSGTNWDISLMTQGAGTVAPITTGFTYNRFRYVPSLKGLVYFPADSANPSQNGYFMRTA